MQQNHTPIPEDNEEIAKKIRSGEFFRESIDAYHKRYVDIISERYFFLGVTAVSLVIFICSLIAIVMLHPLNTSVPFIYQSADAVNDHPVIRRMGTREVDTNTQIKQFLATNYIRLRESYDINLLDRNASGVRSQSTDEVFQRYQTAMDPANPASPIVRYQRQGVRSVEVERMQISQQGDEERMEARVNATLATPEGTRKEVVRVIITFRFDDIKVDQNTGEATPLRFLVTSYESEIVSS